ncbi:MAG: ribosomal RNA small subunit methyltransferase A [Nitrosopumilaceae archaeon]
MKKRHRLGQHFLKSNKIAHKIVSTAKPSKKDTVLEIGTGQGILVPLLCKNAKNVISIEADKELHKEISIKFSKIPNLTLRHGDGFKSQDDFTIFVSNLPYSKSKNAIEWLTQKKFLRAVVMVQNEFAQKLFQEKKAISVLANYAFDIRKITKVGKNNFSPPPKVDSVVLELTRKNQVSKELIAAVNNLFSYRRKTLQNILKQFGQDIESDKRLDDLNGDEIIKIAKQIIK